MKVVGIIKVHDILTRKAGFNVRNTLALDVNTGFRVKSLHFLKFNCALSVAFVT